MSIEQALADNTAAIRDLIATLTNGSAAIASDAINRADDAAREAMQKQRDAAAEKKKAPEKKAAPTAEPAPAADAAPVESSENVSYADASALVVEYIRRNGRPAGVELLAKHGLTTLRGADQTIVNQVAAELREQVAA